MKREDVKLLAAGPDYMPCYTRTGFPDPVQIEKERLLNEQEYLKKEYWKEKYRRKQLEEEKDLALYGFNAMGAILTILIVILTFWG